MSIGNLIYTKHLEVLFKQNSPLLHKLQTPTGLLCYQYIITQDNVLVSVYIVLFRATISFPHYLYPSG